MSSPGGPPSEDRPGEDRPEGDDWSEGGDYYLDEPAPVHSDLPIGLQEPLISPRQRRQRDRKGTTPAPSGSAPTAGEPNTETNEPSARRQPAGHPSDRPSTSSPSTSSPSTSSPSTSSPSTSTPSTSTPATGTEPATDQQSPAGQPAGRPSAEQSSGVQQQPAPDTELRPADHEESDMLATTLTRPPVSTAARMLLDRS